MHRWRVRYRGLADDTYQYFEVLAGTDRGAVEAFLGFVDEDGISLRMRQIGEVEGQPMVEIEVFVLWDGVLVDPGSVGL